MTGTKPETSGGRFSLTVATFGGVGFVPLAPGTAGSAVAAILLWFIAVFPLDIQILGIIGLFFLGVWSGESVERHSEMRDPGYVVIDEVVGMWITLLAAPHTVWGFLFGFTLFRIFDIVKPAPVNQLQSVHGGWGIMLDDVAAAIYAAIIFQIGMLIL